MKIVVIGATGTIGAKVADALSAKKHEVVGTSNITRYSATARRLAHW